MLTAAHSLRTFYVVCMLDPAVKTYTVENILKDDKAVPNPAAIN